jgi:hypothetical protein
MKKEAPFFNEASVARTRIAFYSDNSEVKFPDFLLNWYAVQPTEFFNEPFALSKRRREIQVVIATIEHLSKLGIPPILSAPMYQAVKMKGL